MVSHKKWLDNEYKQWEDALSECSMSNFKEHPMVKRMLGAISLDMFGPLMKWGEMDSDMQLFLTRIDSIGHPMATMSGTAFRMIYYAHKILQLENIPTHIVEVGGGVGEFYAILRALGYKGTYRIIDRPKVQVFQRTYLDYVGKNLNLDLKQSLAPNSVERTGMLVSFYALGEFDDALKKRYKNMIKNYASGFVLWNPHSGATDDLSIFPDDIKVEDEYPMTSPGNKLITWGL